jgi:hypothetical protein
MPIIQMPGQTKNPREKIRANLYGRFSNPAGKYLIFFKNQNLQRGIFIQQ